MSTFAIVHGAGGYAWEWHLVARHLREDGHDVVAVDLPCEDDAAGLDDHAAVVVARDLDEREQFFNGVPALTAL